MVLFSWDHLSQKGLRIAENLPHKSASGNWRRLKRLAGGDVGRIKDAGVEPWGMERMKDAR